MTAAQVTACLPYAVALGGAAVSARVLLARGTVRGRARRVAASGLHSVSGRSMPRRHATGTSPGRFVRRVGALATGPAQRHAAATVAAGALLALWGASLAPLVVSLLLLPWTLRRQRKRTEERLAEVRREAVIGFCVALAGEVRAGRQPVQALLAAGAPGLGPGGTGVLAAARYGGDIPDALRRAAASAGGSGLHGVAACWQVAVDGGASLASGLDRVAEALRAERDQREDVRTQLAGPRATAWTLAALPLVGLLLGGMMGAQPLHVLLHTAPGLLCLVAGVALEGVGLLWSAALIKAAERRSR